jgi:hypothetical protein
VSTAERRKRVMRAVVAIEAVPWLDTPVRAFYVRHFGLDECLPTTNEGTIGADLAWLELQGYVLRPDRRRAEYVSTEAGQRWAR